MERMNDEIPSPDVAQRDDELFDVVDASDAVIGQKTRGEVHANDLLHRAVHIWVFRSDGQLLLQMRSPLKDQYPSTWTSSASGHVDAGETYETAAYRELQEELGLECGLAHATTLPASPLTAFEFTSLWIAQTDNRPKPNAVEVSRVEWWELDDATAAARNASQKFSPPLRELLGWWAQR